MVRGTGIALRTPQYIKNKIKNNNFPKKKIITIKAKEKSQTKIVTDRNFETNDLPQKNPFYDDISRYDRSPAQIYLEYRNILSLWQNGM